MTDAPLNEHPVGDGLDDLIANNRAWAAGKTRADPGFFKRLVAQQRPQYLWIGCSDSRVPANEIVNLDPGEMFVHRNVANLAPAEDANYLSVLQFAIEVLEVRHVLVVGHYGCGGVVAVLQRAPLQGPIADWLDPLRTLSDAHGAELDAIADPKGRHDRLCEINVRHQVQAVAATPFVRNAWARGAPLQVHGWCYALDTGLVNDLRVTVTGPSVA